MCRQLMRSVCLLQKLHGAPADLCHRYTLSSIFDEPNNAANDRCHAVDEIESSHLAGLARTADPSLLTVVLNYSSAQHSSSPISRTTGNI